MPSWGQAAWGSSVPPSFLPLAGPSSQSLQRFQLEPKLEPEVCIGGPAPLPFPELRAPRGGAGGAAWREENRGQEGGRAGADKAGARTGSFWESPNFKYSVQLSDHRPELVGWYLF